MHWESLMTSHSEINNPYNRLLYMLETCCCFLTAGAHWQFTVARYRTQKESQMPININVHTAHQGKTNRNQILYHDDLPQLWPISCAHPGLHKGTMLLKFYDKCCFIWQVASNAFHCQDQFRARTAILVIVYTCTQQRVRSHLSASMISQIHHICGPGHCVSSLPHSSWCTSNGF